MVNGVRNLLTAAQDFLYTVVHLTSGILLLRAFCIGLTICCVAVKKHTLEAVEKKIPDIVCEV